MAMLPMEGLDIEFSNEMICTPFRNTTPSNGTLTLANEGIYLIGYFYSVNGTPQECEPTVVSGSMTIKKRTKLVVTANNMTTIKLPLSFTLFLAKVTAGTVIRGQFATNYSFGYAVKID